MKKTNYQKVGLIWMFALMIFYFGTATNCFALDFGGMATTINSQTTEFATLIKTMSFVVGLCLVAASVVSFATMKKTQTPIGVPIGMLIAGMLLVSLPMLISTGSTSFFGTDASTTSQGLLQ